MALKFTSTKKLVIGSALFAVALPVLAQAPRALSIIVNGVPLQGKALNYKGRLYVPLEDVAMATGGTFSTDPATGVVTATVPTPQLATHPSEPMTPPPPVRTQRPGEQQRPFIKVVFERKYTEQNNARVLATIVNQGSRPAENLEIICIFKGDQREINSYVQNVGNLRSGEKRTVEFRLFEGPTGGQYYSPSTATGAVPDDKVCINGEWTRLSYEFRFNYQ